MYLMCASDTYDYRKKIDNVENTQCLLKGAQEHLQLFFCSMFEFKNMTYDRTQLN